MQKMWKITPLLYLLPLLIYSTELLDTAKHWVPWELSLHLILIKKCMLSLKNCKILLIFLGVSFFFIGWRWENGNFHLYYKLWLNIFNFLPNKTNVKKILWMVAIPAKFSTL